MCDPRSTPTKRYVCKSSTGRNTNADLDQKSNSSGRLYNDAKRYVEDSFTVLVGVCLVGVCRTWQDLAGIYFAGLRVRADSGHRAAALAAAAACGSNQAVITESGLAG